MAEAFKQDQWSFDMIVIVLLIMAGLILPIILIPLIKVIGFSEIVEEIAKAGIVLFLTLKLSTTKKKILFGLLFGFLFSLSEALFYLTNIFELENFSLFWQRIFETVPMHMVTVLIILFSGLVKKRFVVFGLIAAILFHLFFNSIAA